jgi:hypothetical protein
MTPRLALLATVAALALAPAAHASTIVHIRDGAVWLIDPDSGREHQVTTSGAWSAPSEADDGTISALDGSLPRLLRQDGTAIPGAAGGEISPDGSTFASTTVEQGCTQFCGGTPPGLVHSVTTFAAAGASEREFGWSFGSWVDGTRALMVTNGTVGLFGPDGVPDNAPTWFVAEGATYDGDWTPGGGGMLALLVGDGSRRVLEVLRAPGPPEVPGPGCVFSSDTGNLEDPTWSPDGTRLAWEGPDGIEVATISNLDDCAALPIVVLVPGGEDPQWSAAPLDPRLGETAGEERETGGGRAPAMRLERAFRAGRRATVVRRLRLRNVPAGATVRLRCSVGRCLRGPATVRVRRDTRVLDLRARLRRTRMPAGTVLEIVVRGAERRAWRISVRQARAPRIRTFDPRTAH